MRRLIPIALSAFIVCTFAWVAVVRLLPKPPEINWTAGIYAKKYEAAARVSGPKIVLVGGSGVHFAYSAELLAYLTGFQVVNAGTHAGLGADFILSRARQFLQPGDIAIVILEYGLINRSPPTSLLSTYVLTSDLRYLARAPVEDLPAILFGYPPLQALRQTAAALVPVDSPLYRASTITPYGDESANSPQNKRPYMLETVRSASPFAVAPPNPQAPASFLVNFAKWAHEHKVGLLQGWPATTQRAAYSNPNYTAFFSAYAETFHRLGFRQIGQPAHYMLPEDMMLDTPYHADSNGVVQATRALAKDLCAMAVCPNPKL